MQTLNLSNDSPEVWCPVKETVTSHEMAGSKSQQEKPSLRFLSSYPAQELEGNYPDFAQPVVSLLTGSLSLMTQNLKGVPW